jgi:hypothetical protein
VSGPDDRDPPRWRDTGPGASGLAAEIRATAQRLASAPGWGDARLAHVRQKLLQRLPADEATRPGRWRLPTLRTWALAAVCVLLGSAATAVADLAGWLPRLPVERPAAHPAPQEAGRRRTRRWRMNVPASARVDVTVAEDGARVAVVDGDVELVDPELGAPVQLSTGQTWREGAPATGAPAPGILPTPPVRRAPAVPSAAPPGGEATALAEAVRTLRRDGNARAALARLERHRQRFPDGLLAREAALARVEALLALDRSTDALQILDGIAIDRVDADRPVALARGELRMAAHRCLEAVTDFTLVLDGKRQDDLAARALFGRGGCRLTGGDREGARADLEEYLRSFPAGPRRDEIRRALEALAQ